MSDLGADQVEALPSGATRRPPLEIFRVFTLIAMSGFGGVLPFAYHKLVEHYRWVTATEFGQVLGVCQILPGPTICNLAIAIGYDSAGAKGAIAAVLGLVTVPLCIVMTLGVVYQRYGDIVLVRHALDGMIAVAAGLILATGLKIAAQMLKTRQRNSLRAIRISLVLLAFAGLGILRWPLIAVVCALAPLGTLIFHGWRLDD